MEQERYRQEIPFKQLTGLDWVGDALDTQPMLSLEVVHEPEEARSFALIIKIGETEHRLFFTKKLTMEMAQVLSLRHVNADLQAVRADPTNVELQTREYDSSLATSAFVYTDINDGLARVNLFIGELYTDSIHLTDDQLVGYSLRRKT